MFGQTSYRDHERNFTIQAASGVARFIAAS